MIKYSVKKDNQITHSWTSDMYDENHYEPSFGKPQWIEQIEEVLEVKNEAGEIIIPAQPSYQIVHPAEYEIIVEDITAQIAAEQAQIDAIKAAQQQAGMRLMLFPQQVDDCHDLDALKATIKLMVSDIAVLLVK